MRANPGEWFKVFDHDRVSLRVMIANGDVVALRKSKGFTSTTTNNTRGEPGVPRLCTLHLRYDPENDEEKA